MLTKRKQLRMALKITIYNMTEPCRKFQNKMNHKILKNLQSSLCVQNFSPQYSSFKKEEKYYMNKMSKQTYLHN